MIHRSAVFALMIVTVISALENARAQSGEQYCEYGENAVLFLIDHTTPYNKKDRGYMRHGLEALVSSLGSGDRLIVHTITGDHGDSEQLFDGCYPGCSDTGILSGCNQGQAARDQAKFIRELAESIKPVLNNRQGFERSAIIQTISVVTREYRSEDITRAVVFSDLIENSSLYPWPQIARARPGEIIERLKKLGVRPTLEGARVTVFGFGRRHTGDREGLSPGVRSRLLAFWERFFQYGDANKDEVSISGRFPE
jgi:hypothetical protein